MADEQVVTNAAVNSGAPSGSAPEGTQQVSAQPPAGEQPVVENTEGSQENRIPKARFDQVIDQRNRERELRAQYEARIQELERARQSPQTNTNLVEVKAKQLATKLGIKEEAAKEILESSHELARAERQAVEQQLQKYEFNRWQENLSQKYKDYQELSPKMGEVWNTLNEYERQSIVSSPRQLEMFYHYVKGMNVDGMVDAAKKQGAAEAYNNKLVKQAVTSTPGASSAKPNGQLSEKVIADMSIEEFQKRHSEINAWLENQAKSRR